MSREWCVSCGSLMAPQGHGLRPGCICDPRDFDSAHMARMARMFWQDVCEERARHCEKNAHDYRAWSWSETDDEVAVDCLRQAEKHERRAAWLRACAEATDLPEGERHDAVALFGGAA